jgi:small-conductance mechanosensitive channel
VPKETDSGKGKHLQLSLPIMGVKKIIWEVLKWAVFSAAVYIRIADPYHFHGNYTGTIARTLINFVIFVIGAKLLLQITEYYARKSQYASTNITLGLRNVYYILLAIAVLMLALGLFGIDYKTLFTSLSIVAAAIAIVTKDFIAEIISGIVLSFSRRILIDDYVKIGDMKGKILDMDLHNITFLNDDDDIIFIPNSTVFRSEIINYTQSDQRRISIDFQLVISQVDNFERLEQEIRQVLEEFSELIEPDSFALKIINLTREVIDLKLLFTSVSGEPEEIRSVRRAATRRMLNYIKSKTPGPASPAI